MASSIDSFTSGVSTSASGRPNSIAASSAGSLFSLALSVIMLFSATSSVCTNPLSVCSLECVSVSSLFCPVASSFGELSATASFGSSTTASAEESALFSSILGVPTGSLFKLLTEGLTVSMVVSFSKAVEACNGSSAGLTGAASCPLFSPCSLASEGLPSLSLCDATCSTSVVSSGILFSSATSATGSFSFEYESSSSLTGGNV